MSRKSSASTDIKGGHYYAIKMRGKNGDVIVCKVTSVRNIKGDKNKELHVLSKNLLTNRTSTKKIGVFRDRMKRITKKQAFQLVSAFEKEQGEMSERRAVVRELAVNLPTYHGVVMVDPSSLEQPDFYLDSLPPLYLLEENTRKGLIQIKKDISHIETLCDRVFQRVNALKVGISKLSTKEKRRAQRSSRFTFER